MTTEMKSIQRVSAQVLRMVKNNEHCVARLETAADMLKKQAEKMAAMAAKIREERLR